MLHQHFVVHSPCVGNKVLQPLTKYRVQGGVLLLGFVAGLMDQLRVCTEGNVFQYDFLLSESHDFRVFFNTEDS